MEERVAELEEAHLAALNAAVRSVAADKDRERDIALASRAQEHARLVKDCEAELRERHEASLVMAQEKHAVAVKALVDQQQHDLEAREEAHAAALAQVVGQREATTASVAFAASPVSAMHCET